jgi:glutamate racemase
MGTKLQPIGILDSGLSGLTITRAISNALPNENFIYLADTRNSPNGDHSKESIIQQSIHAVKFLLNFECKTIVILCQNISANAIDEISKMCEGLAIIINSIDPVVDYIGNSNFKNVGIIGTRSTIESNVYDTKIKNLNKGLMISSLATPLLVPIIEEGSIYDEISNNVIKSYFSRHELQDIEALILANNHYLALKNQLNKFYNFDVELVDTTKILTDYLKGILNEKNLLNDSAEKNLNRYLVTDLTPHQKVMAKIFYESEILLERVTI